MTLGCSCGAYPNCPCGRQNGATWPRNAGLMPREPKGCVCPPGAEATCQRSDCGRRDPRTTTGTFTPGGVQWGSGSITQPFDPSKQWISNDQQDHLKTDQTR